MTKGMVLLAAGGTGGHLFPALALAEELKRREIEVELVTDERAGHYGGDFPARALHQVPSATVIGRSPAAFARTGWTLTRGFTRARRLIKARGPGAVVGFGGYPTFPPLLAATLLKVPTIVHEQNAVMGRANRVLARRVTAIAASYEGTAKLPPGADLKVTVTGNPVRNAVIEWSRLNYEPVSETWPIRLVVFGGSQGARFFSDIVPAAVSRLPEVIKTRLEVVQQCREEDLARVAAAYRADGVKAELAAFFKNLPEHMARSHLVVARSGASTMAELGVLGRPAILVPLPHALDNDQLHNARRLEAVGGAWCLEQRGLHPERLAALLADLLAAPAKLAAAAARAGEQGRPDAVSRLADLVERTLVRNR
jgi:UDP-N-acetylglucosamine--N-acetylmuramyl-(pentapeptide) pyrophosphoryl-undecaprenol N-acetylglucosamine transferase